LSPVNPQACVLTKLPEGPCRLLATVCKKPLSEVDPLLPPSALTRLSKLVCSDASAELAAVLEVELALEAVSVVDVASVLDVEPVLEVDPTLQVLPLEVAAVLEEAACACKAAIRLCMNCCSAPAAVVASVLEEVDEVDPEVLLPLVESVPVVELVLPTPLSCNASMIAPIKPPPGGGGGALVPEVASLPLADVDWL
jgi:hypothetical protein